MRVFLKEQFLKRQGVFLFIFSGGLQYLVDVILFGFFYSFGVEYKISNIASKFFTGFFGFFFNGYVVFNSLKKCSRKYFIFSFFKFVCLLVFQTFLSTLIITIFSILLQNSSEYMVAIKGVTEIIMAFFSFFIQKIFVYKKSEV